MQDNNTPNMPQRQKMKLLHKRHDIARMIDWKLGGLTTLLSEEFSPTRLNMLLQPHTEDGEHSVGWHADDEHLFQGKHNDCRITVCLKMTGLTPDFMVQVCWM